MVFGGKSRMILSLRWN